MADTTGNNKQTILFNVETRGGEETKKSLDSVKKSVDSLRESYKKLGDTISKNPNASGFGFSNLVELMNSPKGGKQATSKAFQEKSIRAIEKEYQKLEKGIDKVTLALEKETKALNKNNKELKEGAEELSHWDHILEEITGNWSKRAGIFMSYRLLSGITNVIEGSLSSVYNLQKEFANIQAITASSDSEIAKLSDTILDLGTETRYATEELAKATVTLGQAGLNAGQIEEVLASVSKLATATGTDLATSVDITTSVLGAWNKTAKESVAIADTLVVAANKTKAELTTMANAVKYAGVAAADLGVSFEEFVAIASAVTDVGLKGTNVGTGLRSVITELANPTKKLEKVFTRLGISLDEVDIRGRGLQAVLQTLRDAGLGAQEAAEGFDRRAATFYLAATAQLDTVKSLREAFLEEGAAMRANETQMNTLSAQVERFVNTVKRDMYGAFKPLLDTLTTVLKLINDIFNTPVLGKFVGRLLVLSTTFKSLTVVVTGLATAYKKVANAHKTEHALAVKSVLQTKLLHAGYIRLAAGVRKANLALRALRLTMGSLLTGLIVTGIGYLVEGIAKSSSSLEDLTNKSSEQQEEINSLAAAYQELTEKGILYSNDTDALAIRIQELNKQFKLQGDELISLSAKYDEVLKKMLEVRQARFDEKTKTDKERAEEIRDKYTPWFGESKLSRAFDEAVGYDDAGIKNIREFINNTKSEGQKKQLTEFLSDVLEYKKLMEGVEAATKITTEDASKIQEIIVNSTIKTNKALESYRKNLQDTLGSESEFSIDKLYGVAEKQLDVLRKEKDVLSKQIEKMDRSGVSKTNPTYISAKEQESSISKTISSIKENINENAKTIVKGTLAQAENSVKNVTKLLNTAQTSQPDETLLKLAEDTKRTLIEAVSENAKREIESITYKEGSYLYNREVARIEQSRDAMIERYVADLDKATFKYLHNIENIINALRLATQRAELSRATIERSNKSLYGNRAGVLGQVGSLSSTLLPGDGLFSNLANKLALTPSYATQRKSVINAMSLRSNEMYDLSVKLDETQANKELLETEKNRLETELLQTDNLTKQLLIKELINDVDRQIKEANTAESSLQTQIQELDLQNKSLAMMKEYLTTVEKIKQGSMGSFGVGLFKGAFDSLGDDIEKLKEFDKAIESIGTKTFTTFVDNFTDAVTQFANSEKSFSEALREFVVNSLRDIGNWLIQLGIKAVIYTAMEKMFPGFFATLQGFGLVGQAVGVGKKGVSDIKNASETGKAGGGMIRGGIANRDSVNAKLMPGEYVLKKSAVDYLGENFLNSLNHNTEQTLNAITPEVGLMGDNGGQSVVNVWVVSKEEQAGMGPNDVIATITKDIRTGGTTRQLIKSVIAGRK
jgi:TP901 family phage tail tape measure protein